MIHMIQYDPHSWVEHLCDIKGSLVREIAPRVIICVFWAILVVAFNFFVMPFHIQPIIHSLVGVALGLLLVFRTNASYDRFWEGRKAWGSLINESRNIGRQSQIFLAQDPELFRRTIIWTVVFSHALMNRLRGSENLGSAESLLSVEERELVTKSKHYSFACSIQISQVLDEARRAGLISDYIFGILDQNVQLLVDYLGICERICKTPLPFAYVVHLRRAMVLYCYSLPFALVEGIGWLAPLGVLIISYVFYGIEEIGVEIENPFGFDENDLSLEEHCETIQNDLLFLLPKPSVSDIAFVTQKVDL